MFDAMQTPGTDTSGLWDVIILGGGLAGLCLARQLRQRMSGLRVAVIERDDGEIPVAAHKVGESTVEGGAHYLRNVLGLRDYVDQVHLPKLGLRFFGPSSKSFTDRFEVGALDFAPVPSVQLDRGILERDLRRLCVEDGGVALYVGAQVTNLDITQGDVPHVVTIKSAAGETELRARWVVDASGRRRLVAQKLGLIKRSPHHASASWWRQRGVFDMSNIVAEHPAWTQRTKQRRWYSTNHVFGHGYWVWVIPLSSDNTSVGIVTDERIHPVRERASIAKSRAWLLQHEPELAAFLGDAEPLDFLALREFAHTTQQAFSEHRWACVGEAAAFTDPLYSMGTDLIAWANTLTTNIIEDDMNGRGNPQTIEFYDRTFRSLVDTVLDGVCDSYHVFGNDRVTLYKLLWDALYYFSFSGRALLHGLLDDRARLEAYWHGAERMIALNNTVQDLFRRWARSEKPSVLPPGFYHPFVSSPVTRLCVLGAKELQRQPQGEFLAEQEARLLRFEEIAAALFALAATDGMSDVAPPASVGVAHAQIIEELLAFSRPLDVNTLATLSTQAIREVSPAN